MEKANDTEWIIQYMRLRRKRLVRFMDDLGVLRDLQFWTLHTEHKVRPKGNGFLLESSLLVRDIDVREVLGILKANHFYPDVTRDKNVDLGYKHWRRWMPFDLNVMKVGFAFQSRSRACFYYQIFCPRRPLLRPDESLESSVIRIWLSIVFSFRFDNLHWISRF